MSDTANNDRPSHLPDFKNPPLVEVVLGIQFTPPNGYQQIYAGNVWDLFSEEYSKVEEQVPLEPMFETFGLSTFSPLSQFKVLTGATHDRFWFVNSEGDELIQFQNDRLLHNWREKADQSSKYPRFENMVSKFSDESTALENYMSSLSGQALIINQCEVTYINSISVTGDADFIPNKWFSFCNFITKSPNDFNFSFREIIYDENSAPQGRLIVEAVNGLNSKNEPIIRFTLTVRGAPKTDTLASALDFLAKGREIIVCRFAELTTDYAHEIWGRLK